MAKVDVNGDKADPLFAYLKSEKPGMLGTTSELLAEWLCSHAGASFLAR